MTVPKSDIGVLLLDLINLGDEIIQARECTDEMSWALRQLTRSLSPWLDSAAAHSIALHLVCSWRGEAYQADAIAVAVATRKLVCIDLDRLKSNLASAEGDQ